MSLDRVNTLQDMVMVSIDMVPASLGMIKVYVDLVNISRET